MKYILCIFMLTLLSGCPGSGSNLESYSVLDGGNTRQQEELAQKAVEVMSHYYVVKTGFEVLQNGDGFGLQLENELRKKGFAAGSGQELKLRYIVDYLESSSLYMSVRLSDGVAFSVTVRVPEQPAPQNRKRKN